MGMEPGFGAAKEAPMLGPLGSGMDCPNAIDCALAIGLGGGGMAPDMGMEAPRFGLVPMYADIGSGATGPVANGDGPTPATVINASSPRARPPPS